MSIIINTVSEITCDYISNLLALPVKQITTEGINTTVKIQCLKQDITSEHQAVLRDIFNGQVVTVEVVD